MSQHRARRLAPCTLVAALALLLASLATPAMAAPAPEPLPQAPTAAPTPPAPTDTPSASPTGTPSATPADTPSASPTDTPSASPTDTPSASPTGTPSATPAATSSTAAEPAATAAAATPTLPGAAAAPAQAVSLAISKTLRGSDVVQVGQYLTFTIQITNTGSEAITALPLVDEYETSILQPFPERASPPPTTSEPGVMRWDDLTATFGELGPGESVEVTVVFRAVRIDDEVINRARVEAAQGSGGGGGGSAEDEAGGAVEGGQVIVEKRLVESFIRLDTPVISFTISLRNEGSADIVRAPLADTYRADLLSFVGASVPPDFHDPATGELRWNDLLASLGVPRLRPQEMISFTTTYSVTGPIEDAVVNSADAVNVADEFGNQVASPRRAEVRIRIGAPDAQSTPTPEPEPTRRPARTPTSGAAPATAAPESTPTPAGTPAATTTTESTPAPAGTPAGVAQPTVTAQATAAPTVAAPSRLPNTGAPDVAGAALLAALLALAAGAALLTAGRGRRG